MEVQRHLFTFLAVDASKRQALGSGRFMLGQKSRISHWLRKWMQPVIDPSAFEKINISSLSEIKPYILGSLTCNVVTA